MVLASLGVAYELCLSLSTSESQGFSYFKFLTGWFFGLCALPLSPYSKYFFFFFFFEKSKQVCRSGGLSLAVEK